MLLAQARTSDGRLLAAPEAIAALEAHALAEYPREAIGYIDRLGGYQPMRNHAPDPTASAQIDKRALLSLIQTGGIRALCHSHPNGPDCPSEQDMRAQMEMDVPFVIVATNGQACAQPFCWGDGLADDRPLIGRPFRHGVDDCYALCRAWYRLEHGVQLPDYPRGWNWWGDGYGGEADLYRRFFADAGFVEIAAADVRHGDAFLAALRSSVPNHAGICLEGGLALHHASSGAAYDPARLSKRDVLSRWVPYVTHWLRRY